MKKFLALAACALLFSPLAKAQYVLTIDITDINNVVISATGENATADSSGLDGTLSGFTLLNFLVSIDNIGGSGTGNLLSNGMTSPYEGVASTDYAAGLGWGNPGTDLTILFGAGPQNFSTESAAFSGSVTFNLFSFSALLPAIGTTGEVRAGDGFILVDDPENNPEGEPVGVGPLIGQYRVVPEPSAVLLVTAAGVAFLVRRRR